MKVSKVYLSKKFLKSIKKLTAVETRLYLSKYRIFLEDPYDVRLKSHALKGELKGLHSFSVNYSIRVLFEFVSETEVSFDNIGTHEVYK